MTSMSVYVDISLTAWLTVFVVDLSGFTQSWKGALARWLRVDPDRLKVKPLDCSLCMTWWVTLAVTLAEGRLGLDTACFCGLCALLADVMGSATILVKDVVIAALDAVFKAIRK